MTAKEILTQLQALGLDSYKKVMLKHDVKEPLYGVKIEELQKIRKQIKNGYALSLELYDTGIYDAMYLAGLIAQPELMTESDLQQWAENANCYPIRESTVAWVTAESRHGIKKALEWIKSGNDELAGTGWATLASILTITDNSELDMALLTDLLATVTKTIHQSGNRVKKAMNSYVIALGTYVPELNPMAKEAAIAIGKVKVDMGDTACKVPYSLEYIEKAESKNSVGKKRKSARCL